MDDIVVRLRKVSSNPIFLAGIPGTTPGNVLASEAADEIDRLRRVVDAAQFRCDICGEMAVDAVDGWGRCRDHIDYDPHGNQNEAFR